MNNELRIYTNAACNLLKKRVKLFYSTHPDIDKPDDEVNLIIAVLQRVILDLALPRTSKENRTLKNDAIMWVNSIEGQEFAANIGIPIDGFNKICDPLIHDRIH